MYRFWSSNSKECEKPVESSVPSPATAGSTVATAPETSATPHPTLGRSPKRRRSSASEGAAASYQPSPSDGLLPAKRAKAQSSIALPSPQSSYTGDMEEEEAAGRVGGLPHSPPGTPDLEDVKDVIQYQFSHEVLLKHAELRLIDQELAKCQIALEQLRRCHLIPYPVTCPTPAQMVDISNGRGPALRTHPGDHIPEWAPPFGVVDGPYSRHYAKWLIPDPVFDGMDPDSHIMSYVGRAKNVSAAGRTTRNSLGGSAASSKRRSGRGAISQSLEALSSGREQVKERPQLGPCVIKRRADGEMVNLVCKDCSRWDFSSTQGFINHCRIAHKNDYKSHEAAAIDSGWPLGKPLPPLKRGKSSEVVDTSGTSTGGAGAGGAGDEDVVAAPTANSNSIVSETPKPVAPKAPQPTVSRVVKPVISPKPQPSFSGLVHPFARNEQITDQQAYAALKSRISASLALYHAGRLPNVKSIPGAPTPAKPSARPGAKATTQFQAAQATPYLSELLRKKEFDGNLGDLVGDAKTKEDEDDVSSVVSDDSEELDTPIAETTAPRSQGVMRVPVRAVESPVPLPTIPRPISSKKRTASMAFSEIPEVPETPENDEVATPYDEMDMELSPNAIASNNAPSLVSDDGEYDDSDDGSASETSEAMGPESISDIAEINIDEDNEAQDHGTPRPIRHHRSNSGTTVKLKKDEGKQVTFVTPITGNTGKAKGRRKPKAA